MQSQIQADDHVLINWPEFRKYYKRRLDHNLVFQQTINLLESLDASFEVKFVADEQAMIVHFLKKPFPPLQDLRRLSMMCPLIFLHRMERW